jgi:hypothetical protein
MIKAHEDLPHRTSPRTGRMEERKQASDSALIIGSKQRIPLERGEPARQRQQGLFIAPVPFCSPSHSWARLHSIIDLLKRRVLSKELKVETESASLTWIGRPFHKNVAL